MDKLPIELKFFIFSFSSSDKLDEISKILEIIDMI